MGMGKCVNFTIPSLGKWRGIVESCDLYDVLGFLLRIPLQTLFVLGTICLTLQITWRKIRPLPQNRRTEGEPENEIAVAPQDITVKELRDYDGVRRADIYVAVNGKVFDVSSARNYFGPNGPDSGLAGRDASRALVTFSLDGYYKADEQEEMDDLSDLNPLQRDYLLECETQYMERYICIGRLVNRKQPKRLEQSCVDHIRRTMLGDSERGQVKTESVNELPLPHTMKNKLLDVYKRKRMELVY